ncbi:uncharacterized protein zgc:152951 isoform X2 [Anguilla anguilla]|uniref:uncharacterized protein zgc:152951 isoform X2 n=1 Tax=Anguilla anguilla TaxID=7936 RepID=UPI0015AAF1A7|nr:uncharacterized protein zgc:152951 isoform X2 [Anguilla anguilla]
MPNLNTGSPMEETEKSQKGMVTIYSVMGCPHCRQAKSRLLELGLPLREVDTNQHAELWLRVKQLTGRSTVPQIFFNSVHVGGNDDLQTMAPEKLEHLVHLVREEPMPPDAPPLPVEAHLEGGGNQDGENKCERDDFADMVAEFKECGVIGNHRKGLKMYKNSFTGVQLLDWLEREKGLDRSKALETSKTLMDRKFFNSVPRKREFEEGNALFRLVEHGPHSALNAGQMAACVPLQAAELSEILRNMMLRLYSDHLSADGKTVDYKAMSQSPSFERYCELAVQLQRLDLQVLSRAEKLAFFINIYNALVIHGNLRLGAPKNPWQRYRFFNYVSYLIGGEVFTLQDIENGVLRGNKKGVAQLLKPFSKSDPRLQVALPQAEPLIHFALNCGAKGCPPIKTYTPKDIDSQLHIAAEAFLEEDDACRVDADKGEVKLSQVFKWYRGDFGDTDEKVLNWIVNHMSDSPKKSCLQALLKAGKFRVSYMPYDWSPNSKD